MLVMTALTCRLMLTDLVTDVSQVLAVESYELMGPASLYLSVDTTRFDYHTHG